MRTLILGICLLILSSGCPKPVGIYEIFFIILGYLCIGMAGVYCILQDIHEITKD